MSFHSLRDRGLVALTFVFALGCEQASAATSGPDSETPAPAPAPAPTSPGLVSGVALDTHGKPIAGAKIWVRPALTTGLLTATTDANGRYRVQAASNLPYHAYAWSHVSFRGRNLCLRLASTRPEDYDSFVPAEGVTRDFRLQLSGEIEAHSGDYFGAEMRLFVPSTPEGQKLEVALVPDGPLLDGSAGQTIVLDGAELLPQGIPIGVYKASAAFVAPSGARTPLEVSFTDRDDYASETTVQFESTDSCVGSTASGPDRAFLWIRVPGGE